MNASPSLDAKLAVLSTYEGACRVFEAVNPGIAGFCSKNVCEVVLNAVNHCGLLIDKFPTHIRHILADFMDAPETVYGPVPAALMRRFSGEDWSDS